MGARASRAIELVQDGFRYLSVNLELGGQVPAPAETVIRRRYGDCKDVAFLLVRLLRAVGVTARPVLVNSAWRQTVGSMLPSPSVFNHVVVEFEVANQKRWVDATLKCQGGGALTRRVPDFGFGLPVDADSSALAPVPAASLPSGLYEIKESFLLDTFGNPSYLGVSTVAKGIHAEELRFEFENEGIETVAKKRLQHYADRFSRAARIGELRIRDDRDQNEFEIAEAFEIDGFLRPGDVPDSCLFQIQSDMTAGMLFLPSPVARRSPLALPFPCNRVHTVEVDFNGLQEISLPACNVGNKFFSFSRRCKSAHKYLKVTFSFSTLAECIPPEQVQEHRKRVEEVWQASMFQVRLAAGFGRMRMRSSFGQLSTPSRTAPSTARAQPPAATLKQTPLTPLGKEVPRIPAGEPPSSPRPALPREAPASHDPASRTPSSPPVKDALPLPAAVPSPPPGENSNLEAPPLPASKGRPIAPDRSAGPQPISPGTRSSSRSRRGNKRCAQSVWLLMTAVVAFILASLFVFVRGDDVLVGLLMLLTTVALICALTFAAIGLNQCLKHPERYPRGQVAATSTLILGTLFGCALLVLFACGVWARTAQSRSLQTAHNAGSGRLEFDAWGFDYISPPAPWLQADARAFSPGTVLGFGRPEPMYFTVYAGTLDRSLPDARARVIEFSKTNLLAEASSYRLISEGEVERNCIAGWEMESTGNFQGHEFYLVQWLLATNGFGYQLTVWGPTAFSAEIKRNADTLFRNFLPTTTEKQTAP